MKFTVDIAEALNLEIKAAAEAAGTTRAEWTRAALVAALHPPPSAPIPVPSTADEAAGVDLATLSASAAALRAALEARDAARSDLGAARQALAEALQEVGRLQGMAEERLARVADAHETIARLTPEADRTPAPLMIRVGVLEGMRQKWAAWRDGWRR
jgi:hypothetical protein